MDTKNFKRVFVWEIPVRIFHWLNVLALFVLIVTGFIIANPPAILSNAEATDIHPFGTIRFLHFASAYIFFFVMILRLYWAFVGNKYASWKAFWPFSKKTWNNFWHVLKVDIFLFNDEDDDFTNISVGHNSVAKLSYIIMFFLALVQIFTGFALYADMSDWWLPKLFTWVTPIFGGDILLRTTHHITMWLFIFFSMVHVYLVFYHDWLEGRGEVSSMFGGYKFVRRARVKNNIEPVEEEPIEEESINEVALEEETN